MAKPTEYFKTTCKFLGWGDPKNALWFIGLEEAKIFESSAEEYLAELKGNRFVYETKSNWKELGASGRGIRDYTSKIAQPISQNFQNRSWQEYRDQMLWREGSRIFQSNLYPLGKPSLRDWPSHYQSLFGFSQNDLSDYKDAVRKMRFPLIRGFQSEYKPLATLCFGTAGWKDFEILFLLEPNKAQSLSSDIKVFETERIVLMPFLGQGFSNERAKLVSKKLQDWNVQIP